MENFINDDFYPGNLSKSLIMNLMTNLTMDLIMKLIIINLLLGVYFRHDLDLISV